MFPYADPQAQLDLYHQRAAELARQAADYRLARAASSARHRRFGRGPRGDKRGRPVRSTVTA